MVAGDVPDRASRELGVVRTPERNALYASFGLSMAEGPVSPAANGNFVAWKARNNISLFTRTITIYRAVLFANVAKRCRLALLDPAGADLATAVTTVRRSAGYAAVAAPVVIGSRQNNLGGGLGGDTVGDIKLEANRPLPLDLEIQLGEATESALVVEFGADATVTTDVYMLSLDWLEE